MEDCKDKTTLDSKYALTTKLGSGATAEVFLGEDLEKHTQVAVKILKSVTKAFQQEVNMLSSISNENVLKIIKAGEGPIVKNGTKYNSPSYIVLEYAEKGELFDYVYYPNKGFGEKIGRSIFKDILNGLRACHSNGIAHRDLKMENIMLDKDFNIKIADFGFATLLCGKKGDGVLNTPLGTLAYAAPEILLKKSYDGIKTDIFSLGVVLFTLVTCKMAFVQASRGDRFYRYIIHKMQDKYWEKLELQGNNVSALSKEFKDLFTKMISFNPKERPTIEEIINHPWMKGEVATKAEIISDFKLREITVRQQMEIEKMATENEDNYMVYRNSTKEEEFFNKEVKGALYKGGKRKNILRIKGKINPIKFMNEYLNELGEKIKEEKEIEPHEEKLQFKIIIEDKNEDVEENEDDLLEREKLIIQVKMKYVKENEEYVIQYDKLSGDKFDFCNRIKDMKSIADSLL